MKISTEQAHAFFPLNDIENRDHVPPYNDRIYAATPLDIVDATAVHNRGLLERIKRLKRENRLFDALTKGVMISSPHNPSITIPFILWQLQILSSLEEEWASLRGDAHSSS